MIIYKTTNLIHYKFYVGKDEINNTNYYGSGKLLKRAINKYGKENFRKDILEFCTDRKQLCERERFWIKLLRAQDKRYGYNITAGGDGGDTYSDIKINDPERYKEICKEKGLRRKEYLSIKKENNPQYGKKQSEETIQKRVKKLTGQKRTEETKRKMSTSSKDKPKSEKHKKNISKTKKEYYKNGGLKGMLGKNHSEEANQKNRLKHLNKKQSEETIQKRVKKLTGQKRTEETIKLFSLMRKLYWAKKKSNLTQIELLETEINLIKGKKCL